MQTYNLLSCKGFIAENASTTLDIGGACSMARLVLVGLFFINALVRKWGGEEWILIITFGWEWLELSLDI